MNKNRLYSLKYTVAYYPFINHDTMSEIVNNIEPAMESTNSGTFLYSMVDIMSGLKNNKIIVSDTDKEKLEKLKEEDIYYLEF